MNSFHVLDEPCSIISTMGRSLDRKIRETRKPFMMNHGDIRGSITIGKVADLLVLAGDLNKLPTDKIKELKVLITILNGKVICDRTGWPKLISLSSLGVNDLPVFCQFIPNTVTLM